MLPSLNPRICLLAGETFLIIDRFRRLVASVHLAHVRNGKLRVVLIGHDLCSLDRLGAAVVKALHALLPGLVVQLVQVPLVDIGRQEQID